MSTTRKQRRWPAGWRPHDPSEGARQQLGRDRGEYRRLADEQAQLAQEAARAVDPGDELLAAVPADDRHAAVQHHHEVAIFLALIGEDLAPAYWPALAVGGDRPQLLPAQARVLPVVVRCLVRTGSARFTTIVSIAARAGTRRPLAGRRLAGYPDAMRQTVRSEILRARRTAK